MPLLPVPICRTNYSGQTIMVDIAADRPVKWPWLDDRAKVWRALAILALGCLSFAAVADQPVWSQDDGHPAMWDVSLWDGPDCFDGCIPNAPTK